MDLWNEHFSVYKIFALNAMWLTERFLLSLGPRGLFACGCHSNEPNATETNWKCGMCRRIHFRDFQASISDIFALLSLPNKERPIEFGWLKSDEWISQSDGVFPLTCLTCSHIAKSGFRIELIMFHRSLSLSVIKWNRTYLLHDNRPHRSTCICSSLSTPLWWFDPRACSKQQAVNF